MPVDLSLILLHRVEAPRYRLGWAFVFLGRLQSHIYVFTANIGFIFLLLLLETTRAKPITSPILLTLLTLLASGALLSSSPSFHCGFRFGFVALSKEPLLVQFISTII